MSMTRLMMFVKLTRCLEMFVTLMRCLEMFVTITNILRRLVNLTRRASHKCLRTNKKVNKKAKKGNEQNFNEQSVFTSNSNDPFLLRFIQNILNVYD